MVIGIGVAASLEIRRQGGADHQQVRAAGQTVNQRKTVGKNAGGKRAQQQVFQRGFIRPAVAAQKSHQHVGGNRHHFQADEDQHNVEAGGHAHHAHYGK